jgi:hypothetical protein
MTSIPLPKQWGHSDDGAASVEAVVASITCEPTEALLLRFSEELMDQECNGGQITTFTESRQLYCF